MARDLAQPPREKPGGLAKIPPLRFRMRPRVPRGRQPVRQLRRIALMFPFLGLQGDTDGTWHTRSARPVMGRRRSVHAALLGSDTVQGLKRAARTAFNADTFCGSGRGGSIQCRPKLATLSPGRASPSFPFPVPVPVRFRFRFRLYQPDMQGSSYRSVRLVFVERDRRAFSDS